MSDLDDGMTFKESGLRIGERENRVAVRVLAVAHVDTIAMPVVVLARQGADRLENQIYLAFEKKNKR